MKVLGLTGGVGMGKSTCADLLEQWGFPVVDTDRLAREVVAPGQPALEEIKTVFGEAMVDQSGQLLRDVLAAEVFGDAARRTQLEAIVHPRIKDLWTAELERLRAENVTWAVVVIPLLYETGAAPLFDRVLCLACSARTQRERLRARGWSDQQIGQRNRAQWPVPRKMGASDYVIWTESSREIHASQLRRILSRLAPGLAGSGESCG